MADTASDDFLIPALVRALVYSNYKTPIGFYSENFLTAFPYYESTQSIDRTAAIWTELCTDDAETALTWSERGAHNSAYYRNVTSTRETEKYFEFKRVNPVDSSYAILSRVHKCSYIDRSAFHRFDSEIFGTFAKRPFDAGKVIELIQYLWYIRYYNLHGAKVINASVREDVENITVHFLETRLGIGDIGYCDLIDIIDSVYRVERHSGEIRKSSRTVRRVQEHANCQADGRRFRR